MFIVRPLVWRDLLRESRHRAHFISRTLFVIALGAVVVWIGSNLDDSMPSGSAAQVFMAQYGTMLFAVWAVGQYIALCVLSTVRAAALAEERRRDRLQLLTITRMGERGVLLGTFGSILVRALFTMMLALPVLALSRGFGGFTIEQVCLAAMIAFVAAAHAAALTLMLASLVSGTAGAVVLAFVVQGAALYLSSFTHSPYIPDWLLIFAHSYDFLKVAVIEGNTAFSPWRLTANFALPRIVSSIVFLLLAMRLMRRPVAEPGRYLKRLLTAMDQFFLNFAGGKRRWVLWKSGLGECTGNPIYWRERAISVVGQRDHMIRVLYGSGILLAGVVAVALVGGWMDVGVAISIIGIIGVPLLLAGLLLIVQPALAFVREKERGGMASLVLTPLTPRQFVMGKFWHTLRAAGAPLGVALVFFLLIAGFADAPNTALIFMAIILMLPLVTALVMYVGAGAQTAAGAITGAALSVGGLLVLALPILQALGETSRGGYSGVERLRRLFGAAPGLMYDPIGALSFRNTNTAWLIFSAVLLICSILSARRSSVMRNGVVISLFVVFPATIGRIEGDTLSLCMAIVIGLAIAIYAGIRARKWYVPAFAVALPFMLFAAFDPRGSDFLSLPLLVLLLAAFWQAARYAGAGVFNRALSAVMLVAVGLHVLAALAVLFDRDAFLPVMLCLLALAAGGTVLFLSFTMRQFNLLVERNG